MKMMMMCSLCLKYLIRWDCQQGSDLVDGSWDGCPWWRDLA